MTWPLWTMLVVCLLLVVTAWLSILGAHRWAEATRALVRVLDAARLVDKPRPGVLAYHEATELEGLPAPVQRYFRAVLKDGQAIVAACTVDLAGTINMSPTGARWKAFTSRQHVVARRPGFLWDARVAILPGVSARVVDGYIAGEGLLRAALLGLFTVANVRGGGEIARGEFMRWFAEAAWYPTALLPSQGVRWLAVDDRSANATLVDGPLTLTLLFSFNDDGLLDTVRADARGATVGKEMVMIPWEGRWSDYQWRDGMKMPMTGEAAWLPPEGRKVYFVGTVTALTPEFCR